MKLRKYLVGFLAVFALIPQFSSAEIKQVDFTGQVSTLFSGGNPFGMAPAIGDPISATFIYDTDTVGIPRSTALKYPQLATSYSISIDGHTVTPFDNNWQILIDKIPVGEFVYFEHNSNGPGHLAVDGVEQTSGTFQFTFNDTTSPPLGSNSLPTVFPDLSEWDTTTAFIRDDNTGAQINMTLLTMTQTAFQNDDDDDSVPNDSDLCSDTTASAVVDANGCSDAQVDGDGDGVCDPGAASDGPSMCRLSPPDNCPDDANPGQEDFDDNGEGDACDDDIDGDSVVNDDDFCPETSIPEDVPTQMLLVNRWALTDDDDLFDFDTVRRGRARAGYNIEDTAGCSCEQILAAQGLENDAGHTLFGCSISVMDDWVELVTP